ncbi:MAG: hypothetical protein Q8M39_08240 [Sulfuricurvum sp.]|nr:hypothetical protein [Sulfuricurvum sp.]
MHVQTSGLSPFFNPYASPSSPESDTKPSELQDQLKSEFITVAEHLSPAEKRLYNSLIYTKNFEGAKQIIDLGFLRAAALEQANKGSRLLDIKA